MSTDNLLERLREIMRLHDNAAEARSVVDGERFDIDDAQWWEDEEKKRRAALESFVHACLIDPTAPSEKSAQASDEGPEIFDNRPA